MKLKCQLNKETIINWDVEEQAKESNKHFKIYRKNLSWKSCLKATKMIY
jgi:hypothetical protein